MALLNGLASALESYRGRDRLIRTLGYGCQLIGGVLVEQCPSRSEVGRRLLVVSAQLSHCRTVLRLFDDLAMFVYTKQYGLGAEEEDVFIRWLSVLSNMADQLYYPCEHVAWAADAKVLQVDSARWWTLSTAFWSLSLLLGAVKSLWTMLKLRQKLRSPTGHFARNSCRRSLRRARKWLCMSSKSSAHGNRRLTAWTLNCSSSCRALEYTFSMIFSVRT
uniref:Peroxisomal biogenesis factor 11 gamma n=1 Tax=Rattus norvegicus TaxID=10116 RepID=A0ABK0LQH2_RAT